MSINHFNIRVYAVIIKNNKVLLTKEVGGNISFTKFPGGGLNFGEGIFDCLKRELKEELNAEIIDYQFYHVNEQFTQSAFNKTHQLISIYYKTEISDTKLDSIIEERNNIIYNVSFFWKDMNTICEEDITFEIDKEVIKKLKNEII